MKLLFSFFIVLFSVQPYASDDYWLSRQIEIEQNRSDYAKRVYGKSARVITEHASISDPTKDSVRNLIKRSIAVDVPTAAKVGEPMMKRLKHAAKSPGVQLVGVLAVTEMLEAIGWVMEDGTYVKKIDPKNLPEPAPISKYYFTHGTYFPMSKYSYGNFDSCRGYYQTITSMKSCLSSNVKPGYVIKERDDLAASIDAARLDLIKSTVSKHTTVSAETFFVAQGSTLLTGFDVLMGKDVTKPDLPEPQQRVVPLTAEVLGSAMLGNGYKDPDPDFDNDRVNTDTYTGVKEIYEHDPSGVGNDRANEMDDKLRNAPPTPDNKPSQPGDPNYDSDPKTPKDRSWDEPADEASGGSEQQKDPETGQPTGNQTITIQFPVFCAWAVKMCQWYDDWKTSDKIHQKFEEDVKEHQKEEKTFWEKVKDWFDWTKEKPEPEDKELPDYDDKGIFTRTFDTVFKLSKECPPDIPVSFNTQFFSGDYSISMRWLCIIFTFLGYPLVFVSHCVGIWIMYETVIRKEIKWG